MSREFIGIWNAEFAQKINQPMNAAPRGNANIAWSPGAIGEKREIIEAIAYPVNHKSKQKTVSDNPMIMNYESFWGVEWLIRMSVNVFLN